VRPQDDIRALRDVYRLLCSFKPHIVHTHMAKAGTVGRIAALMYNQTRGRHRPAKTIHTYHGHVFDGYFRRGVTSAFVAIERWLARHTDAIIAVSPAIRDEIVSRYKVGLFDQVRVVPLGFDLGSFAAVDDAERLIAKRELHLPEDAPTVTTVGRLVQIKRQDVFLEMAARLAATHRNTVFLVVGDGELRTSLERRAAELGIAAQVRFLGWRSDLARIYAASDLFVLTSDNEGTPVALIEAMATGVASVATDVGGVRDVMSTERNLVPPGQPLPLADAASRLLADPQLRKVTGEQGRDGVLKRFRLERLIADVVSLYRTLT
jgi:glycosyltransferase involved in cell wall biosynthesis